MGSEFFINSQELEDKIRQLLPSQGGAGQGFDLSASTQIIPIIDLTESASGSNLREDLQKSFALINTTTFDVLSTTTTIINNTGFFRVFGELNYNNTTGSGNNAGTIDLTDGITTKTVKKFIVENATTYVQGIIPFDFMVFLEAGNSCSITSSANIRMTGATRQIANINGELVNP